MINKGRGQLALQALRFRAKKKGDRDNRRFWDGILRDEDAAALAAAALEDQYAVAVEQGMLKASETPFQDFIQFLLDNQEAIKAFIEMIMSLFSA